MLRISSALLRSARLTVASAKARASEFAQSRSGNVATIFAVSLLPTVLLISAGMDYSANVSLQVRLQDAIDAGVLAGANSSNPSTTADQRVAAAKTAFNSMIATSAANVTSVTFSVDPTTTQVSGTATVSRPSQFGALLPAYTTTATASALPTANLVRALDVALCVDATGSMQNTLSAVQNNISNFKTSLDAAIAAAGFRPFDRTRVRVIYYRDFGGNGWMNLPGYTYYARYYGFNSPITGTDLGDNPALIPSNFFDMSSSGDLTSFKNFVTGQYASGGGDLPESGLPCLWTAMHSTWTKVGDTLANGTKVTDVYPIISIYTDAGAHPPDFPSALQNPTYPTTMPTTYAGLLAQWNDSSVIDPTHKSILFYGNPDVSDDYYFGDVSGWETVKTWPGFSNPASLTSANNSFITSLAKGILGSGNLRLTH